MAACRVPLRWGNWSDGAGRTGYGDLGTIRNDTHGESPDAGRAEGREQKEAVARLDSAWGNPSRMGLFAIGAEGRDGFVRTHYHSKALGFLIPGGGEQTAAG